MDSSGYEQLAGSTYAHAVNHDLRIQPIQIRFGFSRHPRLMSALGGKRTLANIRFAPQMAKPHQSSGAVGTALSEAYKNNRCRINLTPKREGSMCRAEALLSRNSRDNRRNYSAWLVALVAVLISAISTPVGAQVFIAPQTIYFPGGGIKDPDQTIGPFGGTGETAVIRDRAGNDAVYIYFYDIGDAIQFDNGGWGAKSVSLLIQAAGSDRPTVAEFEAASWSPGADKWINLGAPGGNVGYRVILFAKILTNDGEKYFDMPSVEATVQVSYLED